MVSLDWEMFETNPIYLIKQNKSNVVLNGGQKKVREDLEKFFGCEDRLNFGFIATSPRIKHEPQLKTRH